MKPFDVAILGAGSWGTAVAIHLASSGQNVLLWGHKSDHVNQLTTARCNHQFLADCPFPENLAVTSDLSEAVSSANDIIIAVPSHAFKQLVERIEPQTVLSGIAWLTKGIEPVDLRLLHEIVLERFGAHFPFAIISGPSFAKEVAKKMPTAITIASNQTSYAKHLQSRLHYNAFRVYYSDDYVGVQIAGAVKNVLAIATGISDGLGFGANARAALITRGLAEMARLGEALGAHKETFMGLAGLGDLVLTCTDNQSRNRRFGLLLGEGKSIEQAQRCIGQVVEGRHNARQVCQLALIKKLDMPISQAVSDILAGSLSAEQAVSHLLSRPATDE